MNRLPIHHVFAPLADRRHILLALRLLLQPKHPSAALATESLREDIERAFGASCSLFGSGREALLAILNAYAFPAGSDVIVQGYTCVVVPNAIKAAGYTPVYADCDPQTLNLDPAAVEAAITPQTKAVICQHTFGIPADVMRLKEICTAHGLVLIEDCAHCIPDEDGPRNVGTTGDAAIFSFGRDKAISGISGGAALMRDAAHAVTVRQSEEMATTLPVTQVRRLLLYPLLYAVAKPLWRVGIGKAFLAAAARCTLLVPVVTEEEKQGHMPPVLHRIPAACAALAQDQWKRRHALNNHRRALVRYWLEASAQYGWPVLQGINPLLPLQKYPFFVPHADHIRARLKRHGIHLDDGWTGCVICPRTADAAAAGYITGDDPHAERIGEQILSLPTHATMTMRQARILKKMLRTSLSTTT